MADEPQAYDTIEFWQGQLLEAESQMSEMTGAPDFRVGSLSISETSTYHMLNDRIRIARNRIQFIRSGSDSTSNSKSGRATGSW